MAGYLARRALTSLSNVSTHSAASTCSSISSSSLDVQKRTSFSKTLNTRLFSETHEWIITDGKTGTVGISDYARNELGDVIFIETPQIGEKIRANAPSAGCLESTKAAHDLTLPVWGTVTEVNDELLNNPNILTEDPLNKGWLYKINLSSASGTHTLMNDIAYKQFLDDTTI